MRGSISRLASEKHGGDDLPRAVCRTGTGHTHSNGNDEHERISSRYQKEWGGDGRAKLIAAILLPWLNPGEPVLDVGAGTGIIAKTLVDEGIAVIGLDISRGMLAQAVHFDHRAPVPFLGGGGWGPERLSVKKVDLPTGELASSLHRYRHRPSPAIPGRCQMHEEWPGVKSRPELGEHRGRLERVRSRQPDYSCPSLHGLPSLLSGRYLGRRGCGIDHRVRCLLDR
jgi:hypothetical protein